MDEVTPIIAAQFITAVGTLGGSLLGVFGTIYTQRIMLQRDRERRAEEASHKAISESNKRDEEILLEIQRLVFALRNQTKKLIPCVAGSINPDPETMQTYLGTHDSMLDNMLMLESRIADKELSNLIYLLYQTCECAVDSDTAHHMWDEESSNRYLMDSFRSVHNRIGELLKHQNGPTDCGAI